MDHQQSLHIPEMEKRNGFINLIETKNLFQSNIFGNFLFWETYKFIIKFKFQFMALNIIHFQNETNENDKIRLNFV